MKKGVLLIAAVSAIVLLLAFTPSFNSSDSNFITYTANPSTENIVLYYKDGNGKRIGSLGNLKKHTEAKGKKLQFAMNGGMFQEDFSPVGCYIEDGQLINKVNTRNASGNFYLKPNGVFYVTKDNKAAVCQTEDFKPSPSIQYATQSGPMLVIDGKIHSAFKDGSTFVNIRNGVGILPNGQVLFAMSKAKVNLYDFAMYFKNKGCKNALYLDGFVSRAYAPTENWPQTDGNFGVMIGVTSK
ncbi:phosphodiester glycosidase family protein [Flavobacterium rhizosphaerae]|uniref:Phosphodiester glycosidase family protein n=1 Tax=Flavobacterium rhizosphaerae TaxID=3163298 RepID=A0ABW8YTK4_9FLAO